MMGSRPRRRAARTRGRGEATALVLLHGLHLGGRLRGAPRLVQEGITYVRSPGPGPASSAARARLERRCLLGGHRDASSWPLSDAASPRARPLPPARIPGTRLVLATFPPSPGLRACPHARPLGRWPDRPRTFRCHRAVPRHGRCGRGHVVLARCRVGGCPLRSARLRSVEDASLSCFAMSSACADRSADCGWRPQAARHPFRLVSRRALCLSGRARGEIDRRVIGEVCWVRWIWPGRRRGASTRPAEECGQRGLPRGHDS